MISFDQFRGNKVLVVNTASACGFTEQYASLQNLYELYQDQLVILGVPSNQFLGQEP
jgi:glutathione peroxidase